MPKASNRSLLDCVEGDCVRIESIQDQGRKFLQFARKNKLVPGKRIEIIRHDEIADSIELKVEQKTMSWINRVAGLIIVTFGFGALFTIFH